MKEIYKYKNKDSHFRIVAVSIQGFTTPFRVELFTGGGSTVEATYDGNVYSENITPISPTSILIDVENGMFAPGQLKYRTSIYKDSASYNEDKRKTVNERLTNIIITNDRDDIVETPDEYIELLTQDLLKGEEVEALLTQALKFKIFSSEEQYLAYEEKKADTIYLVVSGGQVQMYLGELPMLWEHAGGIPVERVEVIPDNITLQRGKNTIIEADVYPTDASDSSLRWLSDNVRVATCDNGLVTATGKGTCKIKVVSAQDAEIASDCTVVVQVHLQSFELIPEHDRLVRDMPTTTKALCTPEDADMHITYASSDENIATVDENGLITPIVSEGSVTITATDSITNKSSSVQLNLAPFDVQNNFDANAIRDEKGQLTLTNTLVTLIPNIRGEVKEVAMKETAEWSGGNQTNDSSLSVKEVQSMDYIPIQESGLQFNLFSRVGQKQLDFVYRNSMGETIKVSENVTFQEPDLKTNTVTFDVECSQEEAQAMELVIPDLKYDKQFGFAFRNDDGKPYLTRFMAPHCQGEWMFPETESSQNDFGKGFSIVEATNKTNLVKAPRKLGFTDGCGNIIPFVFDNNCWLREGENYIWEGSQNGGVKITKDEISRSIDFGARFMMHNCEPMEDDKYPPAYTYWLNKWLETDPDDTSKTVVVKTSVTKDIPDPDATSSSQIVDRNYAIQRDQQIVENTFGFLPISMPIPDGNTAYPQPCQNNMRLLAFACNSESQKVWNQTGELTTTAYVDESGNVIKQEDSRSLEERSLPYTGVYAHTPRVGGNTDIRDISLDDLRNGISIDYTYIKNPEGAFPLDTWNDRYAKSQQGVKTITQGVTHGTGQTVELRKRMDFVADTTGAYGDDSLWLASLDEMLEYMYYKRSTDVVKQMTETGCRFVLNTTIPDYMSFKTYSAIIQNLNNAKVSFSNNLTSFDVNAESGLINFGISDHTKERAERYIRKYNENPSEEALDQALFFVERLGTLGQQYRDVLPQLNRVPSIEVAEHTYNADENKLTVTIKNHNKKWGEIEQLEFSNDPDFNDSVLEEVGTYNHTYYSPTDESSLEYSFSYTPRNIYNQNQTTYMRAVNYYGHSSVVTVETNQPRINGENDLALEAKVNTLYDTDGGAWIDVNMQHATQYKILIDGVDFIPWSYKHQAKYFLPVSIGEHTVIVEVKNNLGEQLQYEETFNYVGAMPKAVFASSGWGSEAFEVDGVGFVNALTLPDRDYAVLSTNGEHQIGNHFNSYRNPTLTEDIQESFGWSRTGHTTTNAYNMVSYGIAETGPYPTELLESNGFISWGAGEVGKIIENVPEGEYLVRVLLSDKDHVMDQPVYVHVNDQEQVVTPEQEDLYRLNTKDFVEFDNVTVGSNGYLYFGLHCKGAEYEHKFGSGVAHIHLVEIYQK